MTRKFEIILSVFILTGPILSGFFYLDGKEGANKARKEGFRIHQNLVSWIISDDAIYKKNVEKLEPELKEIVENEPEIYHMIKFFKEHREKLEKAGLLKSI